MKWVSGDQISSASLTLTSHVVLGKSLKLSGPHFPSAKWACKFLLHRVLCELSNELI